MSLHRQLIDAATFGCLLFLSGFVACAESTNADYALGRQQYQKADWSDAITNLSKSIEAGYDLYDSYCYRAYSRAELGDKYGSVEDCNKIIKLYPGAAGFYWCAQIELAVTNYDGAMADFELGLRLDPKHAPENLAHRLSYRCYGWALKEISAEQLDQAMTNLDRAIHIMPTNSMAYTERGFLKILQGRFESAIGDEYLAIKFVWWDEPEPYESRAFARCEINDFSGALEDCTNALTIYTKWEMNLEKEKDKWGDGFANEMTELKADFLPMQGLQSYVNENYETAATLWERFLNGGGKISKPKRGYIEKWIERAKAKETDRQSILK